MQIILAGMSNVLATIISAALEQSPGVTIAGMITKPDDLTARVEAAQADAVIMQVAEPGEFEHFRPLLLRFPKLKVIGLTSDGKSGFLHELHPRSIRLGELSAATLLTALRTTAVQPTV
jgi:DNA-binding NarL/FixJ family response regulator